MLGAIASERLGFATASAQGFAESPDIVTPSDAILLVRELLRWGTYGSFCEKCKVRTHESSCPFCHVLLPSPRAALIQVLQHLRHWTIEDLVPLCVDLRHDVRAAATEAVITSVSREPEGLRYILTCISAGEAPAQLLDKLMALPADALRPFQGQLASLSGSRDWELRRAIGRSLSLGWIEPHEAGRIAVQALNDSIPAVRNEAVQLLRCLRAERDAPP